MALKIRASNDLERESRVWVRFWKPLTKKRPKRKRSKPWDWTRKAG